MLTNKESKVLQEMIQDIAEDLTMVVSQIRSNDTFSPIENIFRMAVQEIANRTEYKVKKRRALKIA